MHFYDYYHHLRRCSLFLVHYRSFFYVVLSFFGFTDWELRNALVFDDGYSPPVIIPLALNFFLLVLFRLFLLRLFPLLHVWVVKMMYYKFHVLRRFFHYRIIIIIIIKKNVVSRNGKNVELRELLNHHQHYHTTAVQDNTMDVDVECRLLQ